jgi:5'-nucleotidase
LTIEQKIPYIVEWWEQAHELLYNQHINENDIDAMVAETPVDIREGFKELVDKCKEKDVPFLVFSAGVKSIV